MTAPLVFMGTPEFAVPSLQALLDAGYDVRGVFTQPDRPVGRGQKLTAPPVKVLALEAGLPVFQPTRLRGDEAALETLRRLSPAAIVVVAYGQILPESVLSLPSRGCVNVHASLLPRYRGAAPIQWAVLNGDETTGVTTMQMEKGLDTGPMLLERETAIAPDETADALAHRLSRIGAELLVETLPPYLSGDLVPTPQDDALASYAPMLRKEMATLDWTMPARTLFNRVRGLAPWPGTTSTLAGEAFKVLSSRPGPGDEAPRAPGTLLAIEGGGWHVATGAGTLVIERVQFPGKKPQTAAEAARGLRSLAVGAVLGS